MKRKLVRALGNIQILLQPAATWYVILPCLSGDHSDAHHVPQSHTTTQTATHTSPSVHNGVYSIPIHTVPGEVQVPLASSLRCVLYSMMSTYSAASGECAAEASELREEEQQPEPLSDSPRQQEDKKSTYRATPRELLVLLCIDYAATVEPY